MTAKLFSRYVTTNIFLRLVLDKFQIMMSFDRVVCVDFFSNKPSRPN